MAARLSQRMQRVRTARTRGNDGLTETERRTLAEKHDSGRGRPMSATDSRLLADWLSAKRASARVG
ncbi:hypothetical protein GCM10011492_06730 [Flexivirga endophytica]|uniref:Uncharacterized protein n=1 Tax=Flexivirga endophytica TaxID=1849103 RepID=A0A916SW92_9MICO|nr:hypothetical protein GCM10011492_06730 [Flexivirga endophytica]GHB36156.1 hypothetical protein GCM10008112_00880 [Flexivirga endophytica]